MPQQEEERAWEVLLNNPGLAEVVEGVKFKVSPVGLWPAQILLTEAT